MWTPPPDQVEPVTDNGWKPPSDAVVTEQPQQTQPVDPYASFPEASAVTDSNQGFAGKAWDALQVPSQMSNRGLTSLANMVPNPEPTGNLPLDLIKGTPRIAADTMAQAAPQFINRASLITAGALQAAKAAVPLASAFGRGVAGQAEQITGAAPGSVQAAWNDPTLMLAKGKSAASPLYEAAKTTPAGANIFEGLYKAPDIVDKAKEFVQNGGSISNLEPDEALMLRKALRIVGKAKNVIPDMLVPMTQEADAAAKASDSISAGDAAYKRGLYAQSLRNLLPQNKYGGASDFKMGIMAFLENMGLPGKAAMVAMSPAAVGATASAGGAVSKVVGPIIQNPSAGVTIRNLLETYANNRQTSSSSSSPNP